MIRKTILYFNGINDSMVNEFITNISNKLLTKNIKVTDAGYIRNNETVQLEVLIDNNMTDNEFNDFIDEIKSTV